MDRGAALSILLAMVLLARRGVRLTAAPQWRALRRIGRASVSNTWLNNALQVPRLTLPILVTWLLPLQRRRVLRCLVHRDPDVPGAHPPHHGSIRRWRR